VILAEWARLGGTTILNGDRVAGAPLTLELNGVPERTALEIVLRSVGGYVLAPRAVPGSGVSAFDRVMILPTSPGPRPSSVPAFGSGPAAAPVIFGVSQPQGDPSAQDPSERPVGVDAVRDITAGQPGATGTVTIRPGAPEPFLPPDQEPPPPPPPPAPTIRSNPFTTLPGTSRPGAPTPAPPQDDERQNRQDPAARQ
jgi:hypothetical protein